MPCKYVKSIYKCQDRDEKKNHSSDEQNFECKPKQEQNKKNTISKMC